MELFDFQREDVDQLAKMRSRLVGNDPGTGKTYEGIALDLEARKGLINEGPRMAKTLVICPKSVIDVWDRHLCELTDLGVYVLGDRGSQPATQRKYFLADVMSNKTGGYFICNWDSLRLMPELRKVKWLHIIGDEIHRVKNQKSQVTRALKQIPSMYKSGLSGTPADNLPQDLWSILNWLWPKYYTSYWKFVNTYCIWTTIDEKTGEELGYKKFAGVNEETIPALHKEMAPWFTRRRKEDVLKDLPPKYYSRYWVTLEPKQRRAYDQMRKTMVSWIEDHRGEIDEGNPVIANAVVSQLIRLQQYAAGYLVPDIDPETGQQRVKMRHGKHEGKTHMAWGIKECNSDEWIGNGLKECVAVPQWKMTDPSSKLDALMEILSDRGEEQVIVFSAYKQAINLLATRLEKANISYGLLTGDIKRADRDRNIQEFQAGRLRVFAGTIQAGSLGITLTAASTVIFLDRTWSPSVNGQAEDRAHRIGQKDAVEIIDIMAKNTVDLGKSQQLSQKAEWLKMLLGDEIDADLIINNIDLDAVFEPEVSEE